MKQQLIIAFLVVTSLLEASEVKLSLERGKILGMPEEYSPVLFDLEHLSITIKNQKLVFPEGLKRVLMHSPDANPFSPPPKKAIRKPYPYTYEFYRLPDHAFFDDEKFPTAILVKVITKKEYAYYKIVIDIKNLKFVSADLAVDGVGVVPIDLDGVPDNLHD